MKGGKISRLAAEDFVLMQTIAIGELGRTQLARQTSSGRFVSLKWLEKKHVVEQKLQKQLHREISLLKSISSPFLADFIGHFQDAKSVYLCSEFLSGGELLSYIHLCGRSYNDLV